MKNPILYLFILFATCGELFSQTFTDSVIADIVKNNSTLSALRKKVDAEKINNKTGLLPSNPEVEFNYLWGSPAVTGDRTDLKIIQQFDFPSTYIYRNQISDIRNVQAELEYLKETKSIILKARLVCIDLIYSNALGNELKVRVSDARRIADSYQAKFKAGEANILEFNKAQLILLTLSNDSVLHEVERRALLSELTGLNGGVSIDFRDVFFQPSQIPVDFEQWYLLAEQNNPLLAWIKQEVLLSSKQVKLNSAMSLPKLQGGYMSEKVVGEQFKGVTIGISIPIWENKNQVKYAKARSMAVQSAENDIRLQFYVKLKSLHEKAVYLQNSLIDYKNKLAILSNTRSLNTALAKGEISLIEYIFEQTIYYESNNKLLLLERDVNKAFAELYQFQ